MGPNHDTLLQAADERKVDVVMVQEPYASYVKGRPVTKTHPRYRTFLPISTWEDRHSGPRVATYVRKDPRLVAK